MVGRWPRFVAVLGISAAVACAAIAYAETATLDVSGVLVRDVKAKGSDVSGVVENDLPRLVRDVRLVIRYTWLWNDERHPGYDSPGRSFYHTVSGDVPPRGTLAFTYRPDAPLPARDDGHFQMSADVVGYTEVGE